MRVIKKRRAVKCNSARVRGRKIFATNLIESTVDGLCDVAEEILENSKLAKIDPYVSIDKFEAWDTGSAWGIKEDYHINMDISMDTDDFINISNIPDDEYITFYNTTYHVEFYIEVKSSDIKNVYVYGFRCDNDFGNELLNYFDEEKFSEYITKIAEPVVREIDALLVQFIPSDDDYLN